MVARASKPGRGLKPTSCNGYTKANESVFGSAPASTSQPPSQGEAERDVTQHTLSSQKLYVAPQSFFYAFGFLFLSEPSRSHFHIISHSTLPCSCRFESTFPRIGPCCIYHFQCSGSICVSLNVKPRTWTRLDHVAHIIAAREIRFWRTCYA